MGALRARLAEYVRQLDARISLHDLRIVPGDTHTNVLFDLALPAGYAGDYKQLLNQVRQFVTQQDPKYIPIIKLEQSYTTPAANNPPPPSGRRTLFCSTRPIAGCWTTKA